jgi:nucleotide-binding universal stress UspA family protein
VTKDTILVPLDGSPLSERAVPYAAALAKAIGTSVLLLSVREGNDGRVTRDPDLRRSILAAEESHQREYLRGVAERMVGQGTAVETESLLGDPGDEILKAIEGLDPRLLVLATHGRSGLSRWRYGSVAGRLIREAPVPTFVIGPEVLQDEDRTPAVKRILVPLDGSPLAEGALRPAVELAQSLHASIVLLRVVSWAAQPYLYGVPGVDVAGLDREIQKAGEDYLQGTRQALGNAQQVEIQVLRGSAAEALINYVRDENVDLVVMSSHSRSGLVRAVLGSVSDRVLQAAAPVLFVRPEGIAAVDGPSVADPVTTAAGRLRTSRS